MKNKLKAIRELKNYDQNYVAQRMGLSQSAYSKLENSERELDTQTKSMACNALDMSVEEYDRFDPRHVFHISNFNNHKVNSGVINDYHDSIEYLKEMLTSKDETI